MCMSPDMPDMPKQKPATPPPAPAAPAAPAQKTAAEEQSAPEKPDSGKGNDKRTDRDSLRIPKKQSKGLNLPGGN